MGQRKERGLFVCQHCGKEYMTRRPPGEGEKFCSRECSFKYKVGSQHHLYKAPTEHKKYKESLYTKIYGCACNRCGVEYISKNKASKRCYECGKTTIPYKKICNWCNKEYKPTGIGSMQCSDACKTEVKREQARTHKAKRRALQKGAGAESIRPLEIFDRDGWVCKVCGCATPYRLRGTLEDDAPELDHIEPLANGGTHTHDNVQCLCRLCNQIKGTMSNDEFIQWNQGDGKGD